MLTNINQKDLENLVKGNDIFAWNLYQALRKIPGNICYSPYSISSALAMVYAGAREVTEKQMAAALHYQLAQERLHPAFDSLSERLSSSGTDSINEDQKVFKLVSVNSLWGQQGFEFSPLFLDILTRYHHSHVRLLDFVSTPDEALAYINSWVKEQTNRLIPELLPEGSINTTTVFVLTSAVFFKASWLYPFDTSSTPGQFYLLDGTSMEVRMMKISDRFGYIKQDGYQAIELMYSGEELSMVILLPEINKYEQTERELNSQKISSILKDIRSRSLTLSMPGFKFRYSSQLGSTLAKMGMPLTFSSEANFSGMTGQSGIFIQEIFHNTFISVDENGTEAAAATGTALERSAAFDETIEIHINRPFIFFIRDIKTKTVVFIGRVQNPIQS